MLALSPYLYVIYVLSFFATALLYSMVGFGGGSTYLALLVLLGLPYNLIPSTALVCNIIVVSGGCYFFIKERHLSLKCILPFLVTSLPMAYFGGRIPISETAFLLILAIVLGLAGIRMLLNEEKFKTVREVTWNEAWLYGLPIGAGLGFLSGITGIGGGIFLAPVLYYLGWAKSKTVAASASLFILVNSIAGLSGQLVKNSFAMNWRLVIFLAVAVFIGGQIGSRLGARKFDGIWLQRLTAALMLFVSLRIFWDMRLV